MKAFRNVVLFVSLCLSLTACYWFNYTKLYENENNQQIYRATCKRDITNCYQIADKVCENGFILMEWYGKRSYTNLDDSQKSEEAKKQDLFGLGHGRMVFRCK